MLYHVPDPIAALHEFDRVTRPGGRVTVVVNHARNLARTMGWIRAIASRCGADITAVTDETHAWFRPGDRVWRDPKGYVICTSAVG